MASIPEFNKASINYMSIPICRSFRCSNSSEAINSFAMISRTKYILCLSYRNTSLILKFFYQPIHCAVDLSSFISHYLYTKISSVYLSLTDQRFITHIRSSIYLSNHKTHHSLYTYVRHGQDNRSLLWLSLIQDAVLYIYVKHCSPLCLC